MGLAAENGHRRMETAELRSGQKIAFKTLELVNWEPVSSALKMGRVVAVDEEAVTVSNDDGQCRVEMSSFCEIYEVKDGDKGKDGRIGQKERNSSNGKDKISENVQTPNRSDIIKERRKKRKQRQKERKRKSKDSAKEQ